MSFWMKKTAPSSAVHTSPADNEGVGTAADVEAVMKKYDRESNTRIWEGMPRQVVRLIMAGFSVYCLVVTLLGLFLPEQRLTLFLAFIIIIGFLNFPLRKGHVRVNHMPWYDILIMVVGVIPYFYFAFKPERSC